MFAGDGKIIGFDGTFAVAHGDSSTNWDDWDGMSPEGVRAAVEVVDWSRRATGSPIAWANLRHSRQNPAAFSTPPCN